VNFINDDVGDIVEQGIPVDDAQEETRRAEKQPRGLGHFPLKSNVIPHDGSQGRAPLHCHSTGDGDGGDTPGLGAQNAAWLAPWWAEGKKKPKKNVDEGEKEYGGKATTMK
jgi:hypothetical protein